MATHGDFYSWDKKLKQNRNVEKKCFFKPIFLLILKREEKKIIKTRIIHPESIATYLSPNKTKKE